MIGISDTFNSILEILTISTSCRIHSCIQSFARWVISLIILNFVFVQELGYILENTGDNTQKIITGDILQRKSLIIFNKFWFSKLIREKFNLEKKFLFFCLISLQCMKNMQNINDMNYLRVILTKTE